MLKLKKKNQKTNNNIFFKSSLININIFFIEKKIDISNNININIDNNIIKFEENSNELSLPFIQDIRIIHVKNKLFLICINNLKNKKSLINLYNKLIKIKIKGISQGFKKNLILKGIGFKANIENNFLILKLGYSHNIKIDIPANIKVTIQSNNLIFSSNDYVFLTQFVNYIKSFKKPEPYKGKGILLKNEKVIKKEGKKK